MSRFHISRATESTAVGRTNSQCVTTGLRSTEAPSRPARSPNNWNQDVCSQTNAKMESTSTLIRIPEGFTLALV